MGLSYSSDVFYGTYAPSDSKIGKKLRRLMEKREDLRKLRFSSAGSKNRNVKIASTTRKEVARIMTELNKK